MNRLQDFTYLFGQPSSIASVSPTSIAMIQVWEANVVDYYAKITEQLEIFELKITSYRIQNPSELKVKDKRVSIVRN